MRAWRSCLAEPEAAGVTGHCTASRSACACCAACVVADRPAARQLACRLSARFCTAEVAGRVQVWRPGLGALCHARAGRGPRATRPGTRRRAAGSQAGQHAAAHVRTAQACSWASSSRRLTPLVCPIRYGLDGAVAARLVAINAGYHLKLGFSKVSAQGSAAWGTPAAALKTPPASPGVRVRAHAAAGCLPGG